MSWQHLNTAPRDGEIFAHSRTWKRPQFVRQVTGGEYRAVSNNRKVIPQVWMPIPRFA